MKFLAFAALVCTASAIKIREAPVAAVPLSEAKPNAAAGAVDSSRAGVKQHEQAKVDQHVAGFHITDSDAVWAAADARKNGPISTTPIPTPAGPSVPLQNPGKAGNGDNVTSSLAQGDNGSWHCKCMGTTCWDHEGAVCHTHQVPAHGGETCLDNKGKCNYGQ